MKAQGNSASRQRSVLVPRQAFVLVLLTLVASPATAAELSPDLRSKVDAAVTEVLAKTGAPSASIAIVQDGTIGYVHAYGTANLEAKTPATTQMRYSLGSISKQFTAAAVLLLVEEHKLSLDDNLIRFLPELTRAQDVSLRQVLSHTSGYRDFWPQDYVMPDMLEPTTPQRTVDRWARIPLDFEPATKWQYSNTDYVIAGLVVEKVAGLPLFDFLRERVFQPLGMGSVVNIDEAGLGPEDAARYTRYASGPPRPAPKEGKGWLFAAGELAMTAADLAKWDISMIDETLLKPASYRVLETEVHLASGAGTGSGLGVFVVMSDGHRVIAHAGGVSGFAAQNNVFPDDRTAVVVLTNLDATRAPSLAANKIASLLFAPTDTQGGVSQARQIFASLQRGRIDRSVFTSDANAYFSEQALRDLASSLGPLGAPTEFSLEKQSLSGGMTLREYSVVFPKKALGVTTLTTADGKLEQFIVASE